MGYASDPNLNVFDYLLVRNLTLITSAALPIIIFKVNPIDIKPKFRLKLLLVLLGH